MDDKHAKLNNLADLFCDADIDESGIEDAIRQILIAVGEDKDRPGLKRTPLRVAQMFGELLAGYRTDPIEMVNDAMFEVAYDEIGRAHV